ncbi:ammonia-forming cytochrome c nitrite reductase subunit c552 [Pseudoprimorskyibacter insulae]|uniref:nitrite reductase (cytochrome; ammonia-forming) n=1 Tax=Pseudoprimorskyibacter insulae TaxID=1695997 RepID=A0A2R8ARF3_9RHOB|nr:ammonia-forming cytochrome c nitrite reductase subunit c552 [Pseudoprimorskyibacter insulae]SPF78419.1 Cytochrome c-552 [Pseudoprimorskyibacter insulae]
MTRNRLLWILWITLTLFLAGAGLARLYIAGDRTVLTPGQTDGVHHQLEIACETCHTSSAFASQSKIRKDINKTCTTCHKDELKEADDSHPTKKFTNPRMAAYWDKVDARFCTTCHSEHEPEITQAGLVTLPGDYCVACHSEGEQDVRVNRPSHEGLTFDTCASSGCHNYHDNRALYEDFLVKHAGEPALFPDPVHPVAAIARTRARPSVDEVSVYLASLEVPAAYALDDPMQHWAASAHAAADVTCATCHAPKSETADEVEANWTQAPGEAVCATCHKGEAKTFALGRHGMGRHPEIAKPRDAKKTLKALGMKKPPEALVTAIETYLSDDPAPEAVMSTDRARVSLRPEALGKDLTCATCHAPHEQDLDFAAVGACLTCHNDDHSLAYEDSPHFKLWQDETAGLLPPGSGVTCATCHMPQTERKGVVTTNHNQNDTLFPNEKMIRPTCLNCHGLAFSIDALADPALVANNFSGQPNRHIEGIDWAVNRVNQPDEGANQ